MKKICQKLILSDRFEQSILLVILINCALIGVETYFTNSLIQLIQLIALIIFVLEIIIRYSASKNNSEYFKSGWNCFDLSIVLICLVPETLFENAGTITTLRILRVFRVMRLLKSNKEIKLIVAVLWKSLNALFYNFIFFLIFMYLFGIIGVSLFKLPTVENVDDKTKITLLEYFKDTPNAPVVSPDPYGNLSETMFTLFRVLTGEDWTDIRYNLIDASNKGLVVAPPWIITFFHVLWYVVSAFLLLNLLVGAILNNYQIIMNESSNQEN